LQTRDLYTEAGSFELVRNSTHGVFQIPFLSVNSVPLRTGTCYVRDIFVFARLLCSAGITNEMNFTLAVAPSFVHPMTSLPAMPTHSVRKYGFFSEPTPRRQVAKYGNLKRCESLSFSGNTESLEPSKF